MTRMPLTASDPRQTSVQDLDDLPPHELEEIAHFFAIYKSIEPGKGTTPEGWRPRQVAEKVLIEAQERYRAKKS